MTTLGQTTAAERNARTVVQVSPYGSRYRASFRYVTARPTTRIMTAEQIEALDPERYAVYGFKRA